MRQWRGHLCVLFVAVAALLAAPALGYDVPPKLSQDGTAVPDVDKNPQAPQPDQSCWLAAAANVLGAAGWGSGANAQAKADNIYTNDLVPHFGTANTGWSSVAINWWLLEEGLDSGSVNYDPTGTYNNVTHVVGMTNGRYDWLLTQLQECQYVNVSLQPETGCGHEMTLVGGDWSATVPGNSAWHDNNGDQPVGVNLESAVNTSAGAGPNAGWSIQHRGANWSAEDATLLCPGLTKPDEAMQNFDAAYYKDMAADGSLFNTWRHAGAMVGQYQGSIGNTYAEWLDDFQVDIPNQPMPEPWYKVVYLLVDYVDQNVLQANPNIANVQLNVGGQLIAPDGGGPTWDDDGGQALFTWTLDELDGQPANEILVFPHLSYNQLYDISTGQGGPVKDWNVATICIPEPATLSLLALGTVLVLRRRRR